MDIHLKPDVAVALESTSCRPLIDTIINTLRRNDTIHALYMQGAWMSSSQLNRLFEALKTFAEKLDHTYVVQVYFENVTTDIKNMILTACERNRRKLPTLLNLYRIIVPEHIWMMWPRLKTGEEEIPLTQLK